MNQSVIRIPKKLQRIQIIQQTDSPIFEPFEFEDMNLEEVVNPEEEENKRHEQQLRANIEKELKNAYDRGFDDGREVTTAMLEREMQRHRDWLKNFDEITEDMRQEFSDAISQLEETALTLAVAIAEQVLAREISQDALIVIEQIRRAFQKIQGVDYVIIRIHPEDVSALEAVQSQLIYESNGIKEIKIRADSTLNPGDCIVETNIGSIDAQIRTQLEQIHREMIETARASSNEHN